MRTSSYFKPIAFLLLGLLTLILAGRPRTLGAAPVLGRAIQSQAAAGSETTLESVLPRDGLQLYFEVRGEGFSQLAKLASETAALRNSVGDASGRSIKDLSSFALAHLPVLSRARVALVTYTGSGFAIVVQTASPEEARHLAEDLARALTRTQPKPRGVGTPNASDRGQTAVPDDAQRRIVSAARGRVCMAGAQEAVERITGDGSLTRIADDPEFLKSESRFAADPFFGFLATSLTGVPTPPAGEEDDRSYMQGWMFARRAIPDSFTFGGSVQGDVAAFHALIVKPSGKTGPLSAFFSSTKSVEPAAAGLACKDTDLFVDVMIDWDKLYQALAPLVGTIAGAGAPDGPATVASALEQKLGFSVKDDLLPTLGGELAIALHFPSAPAQQARATEAGSVIKQPSMAVYVIVALKDKARFESLIGKLARIGASGSAQPATITTTQYRGATIKSIKGFSYAIIDGFFVGCGGQGNLRKLLDERATGSTLASKPEYHTMTAASGRSLVQVFLSGSASDRFLNKPAAGSYAKSAPGLGFVMSEAPEGVALNVRIPASLLATALSSAMNTRGGVFGIGPSPESAAQSNRTVNGKPVPRMTSDELPRQP